MIDSDENMVLEFNYLFSSNKEAIYKLEFDEDRIVYESFHCQLEKNMIKVYEISNEITYFNDNLVMSEKYESEIKEKVLKYFGKHSFLAIIFNERRLTNVKYMNQNITQAFLKAIDELNNCLLLCKHPKTEEGFIKTSKIIHNLQ